MAVLHPRLAPHLITLALAAAGSVPGAQADPTWADYTSAARAALAAHDDSAAADQFERRDALVGGHPGTLYVPAAHARVRAGRECH